MKKRRKQVVGMPKQQASITPVVESDVTTSATKKTTLLIMNPQHGTAMPLREVSFLALENGDLVELVENPDDANQTMLAIFHEGKVRITEKLEYRGQIIAPIPRDSPELVGVKLPRGVYPYGSVAAAFGWLLQYIPKFVGLPAEYVGVVASFIIYTWVADRLPVAVYLSLIGPPGSGKTTLLELLWHLCRRAVMVSDISISATSQICTSISPTMLIDENDWDESRGSLARRQQLRAGTTQNAFTRRKGFVGRSFGPKVLTALEPPDDPALNRRCVQIPMIEVNDAKLLKPSDPRWFRHMEEFQKRMLQLRFDLYPHVKPAVVPGAEDLRPGTRDLLTSLAAPSTQEPQYGQFLLAFLSENHDPQSREPLSPSQNATVAALFRVIHYVRNVDHITMGKFSEFVNQILAQSGERGHLQARKVGAVLSSLGFLKRVRTNRGIGIALDLETRNSVHIIVKNYGNQCVENWIATKGTGGCAACEEQVATSKKVAT